jgi:hypothetical protein
MTYWSSSVVYCALLPIFVVSHELGHAAVSLARSKAAVSVALGRPPGRWRVRLGRLDVTIGLNFWSFRKPAGTVSRVPLDKWSTVACGLAGPLAQAAASVLLIPVGVATHRAAIGDAGIVGIGFALTSLVPLRFNGFHSDGASLLQLLRRKNTLGSADPVLVEKLCRWLALFKDLDGTLGRSRGRVLNAVPHLVEHPGSGPDSLAVWRISFAGWCWRAVGGDASMEMREAALEAIREATSSGAVEPDLSIIAAHSLAGRESSAGYEHVTVDMRSPAVDDAKQRWAFQFGVAFYDIERARGLVG